MKKLLFFIVPVVMMIPVKVFAQEAGDMAVGINIVFTPNWIYSPYYKGGAYTNNAGIGAKFQYNVTTPIRVEGTFNLLGSDYKLGMWYVSINANYIFPVTKKLNVYPVAGFDLMKYRDAWIEYDLGNGTIIRDNTAASDYTLFGVNIGGGVECKLSKRISLQGEVKYIIGFDNSIFSDHYKTNRLMISIGAVYKF